MGFIHISTIVTQHPRQSEEGLPLLRSAWPSIAGEHAPVVSPLAIHNGTLTLQVEGRQGHAYVKRERRELIKEVNALLGEGVVTRLIWVEGAVHREEKHRTECPKPSRESLEIASVIRDETLREKFIRLLAFHQEESKSRQP